MKKIVRMIAGIGCIMITVLTGYSKLPVQAAERAIPPYILDVQKKCTLEIQTEAAQKTEGTRLAVYQVGKIDATSLSLSFVLNEAFEESKVDLTTAGNTERKRTIEALYEYVLERQIAPFQIVQLDEQGSAQLTVPQGAYLICQAKDGETQIQATLVGVPRVSETLDEWQYQMAVRLKVNLSSVATGDGSEGGLFAALAIAAAILLLLMLLARKRYCKNK